jgi:cation diffusion facilitator CzcD-associated flavoprotein CzcO
LARAAGSRQCSGDQANDLVRHPEGDIDFSIDDKPLVFSDTVTYRGMMLTGVPNMAWVFGYFRASWSLRADLVGDFVCRLLIT